MRSLTRTSVFVFLPAASVLSAQTDGRLQPSREPNFGFNRRRDPDRSRTRQCLGNSPTLPSLGCYAVPSPRAKFSSYSTVGFISAEAGPTSDLGTSSSPLPPGVPGRRPDRHPPAAPCGSPSVAPGPRRADRFRRGRDVPGDRSQVSLFPKRDVSRRRRHPDHTGDQPPDHPRRRFDAGALGQAFSARRCSSSTRTRAWGRRLPPRLSSAAADPPSLRA